MVSNIKRISAIAIMLVVMLAAFSVAFCDETYAASKPGKVKNFKITKVTSSSCSMSWSKVRNAKGYKVYMKKGSGKYKLVKTTTKRTFKKTKLKSSTKYTFKVKAYKKSGKKKIYGKYSGAKTIITKKKIYPKTKDGVDYQIYVKGKYAYVADPLGFYKVNITTNKLVKTISSKRGFEYITEADGKLFVQQVTYDDPTERYPTVYANLFSYSLSKGTLKKLGGYTQYSLKDGKIVARRTASSWMNADDSGSWVDMDAYERIKSDNNILLVGYNYSRYGEEAAVPENPMCYIIDMDICEGYEARYYTNPFEYDSVRVAGGQVCWGGELEYKDVPQYLVKEWSEYDQMNYDGTEKTGLGTDYVIKNTHYISNVKGYNIVYSEDNIYTDYMAYLKKPNGKKIHLYTHSED